MKMFTARLRITQNTGSPTTQHYYEHLLISNIPSLTLYAKARIVYKRKAKQEGLIPLQIFGRISAYHKLHSGKAHYEKNDPYNNHVKTLNAGYHK